MVKTTPMIKMDATTVSYTKAVRVDKDMRLMALIQGRINKLNFHIDILELQKASSATGHDMFLTATHERRILQKKLNKVKRLASNHNITHSRFLKAYGDTKTHMKNIFGEYVKPLKKEPETEQEKKTTEFRMEQLRIQTREGRITEHRYRLVTEMCCASTFGWYMVFSTLSCRDNKALKSVFTPGSRDWGNYIRRWNDATINHRYFAVVEQGAKNGRLHIHCMHIFQDMVGEWNLPDPNLGRVKPNYREVSFFRKFWIHGMSWPIAVRLSANDAWAKRNWLWPVKKDKFTDQYKPVRANPPAALGRYMTKYITKAYGTPTSEEKIWRVRATHTLGLTPVRRCLKEMTPSLIFRAFLYPPDMNLYVQNRLVRPPRNLMQTEATRYILNWLTEKHPKMKLSLLATLKAQPSISALLQTLMNSTTITSNLQSIIPSKVRTLSNTDISKIQDIWETIEDHYYGHQLYLVPAGVTIKRKAA